MKKLAIISAVLLLAGIASALGQTGSCNCPAGTSCGPSECLQNCSGACALDDGNASSCAAACPIGNCGSAPLGRGGCAVASCCGAAN